MSHLTVKRNKIKLGIFLLKLQDYSGRSKCCICTALQQTKIPSSDKMAAILPILLLPILKKVSWNACGTILSSIFCCIPQDITYHLGAHFAVPHRWLRMQQGERGQFSLKLLFNKPEPTGVWWPSTNISTAFPLLSSLPFSGLSNALVVFATRPQVIPLGTLLV